MTTDFSSSLRALAHQKLVERLEKTSRDATKLRATLAASGMIHSGRAQFQFIELFQQAIDDYRLDLQSVWTERVDRLLPRTDAATRQAYVDATLAAFDAGSKNFQERLGRAMQPPFSTGGANALQQLQPTIATRRQGLQADLELRLAEHEVPAPTSRYGEHAKGASGHRLAAVAFGDIVGSSTRMGTNEANALADRSKLMALVNLVVEKHQGRVVSTAGDNFFIEFGSGIDGLSALLDILVQSPLPLRTGFNVCEVAVVGDDILGDGVNIASRLESHATPGHICLPAHVAADLAGQLKLALIDRGTETFKNIGRPIQVVEIDPRAPRLAAVPKTD